MKKLLRSPEEKNCLWLSYVLLTSPLTLTPLTPTPPPPDSLLTHPFLSPGITHNFPSHSLYSLISHYQTFIFTLFSPFKIIHSFNRALHSSLTQFHFSFIPHSSPLFTHPTLHSFLFTLTPYSHSIHSLLKVGKKDIGTVSRNRFQVLENELENESHSRRGLLVRHQNKEFAICSNTGGDCVTQGLGWRT